MRRSFKNSTHTQQTFTKHCISLTMLNKDVPKLHGGCTVTQASSVGLSVSGELRWWGLKIASVYHISQQRLARAPWAPRLEYLLPFWPFSWLCVVLLCLRLWWRPLLPPPGCLNTCSSGILPDLLVWVSRLYNIATASLVNCCVIWLV